MNENQTQIGLDFVSDEGIRETTFQLLRNGRAVATAHFSDGKLSGKAHSPYVSGDELRQFLKECGLLLETETPSRFI